MELVSRINSFLAKQEKRIYIKPGQKAPKGAQITRGKRGGLSYVPLGGRMTPKPEKTVADSIKSLSTPLSTVLTVLDKYVGKTIPDTIKKELLIGVNNIDGEARRIQSIINYKVSSAQEAGQTVYSHESPIVPAARARGRLRQAIKHLTSGTEGLVSGEIKKFMKDINEALEKYKNFERRR